MRWDDDLDENEIHVRNAGQARHKALFNFWNANSALDRADYGEPGELSGVRLEVAWL